MDSNHSSSAIGLETSMRISLFITCYNDTLFPEIGIAVVRVLERLGHTIDFPYAQTCCGQMHYNTGYQPEALPLVRRFVEVFRDSEVVCVPSSSCVTMMREHYEKIASGVRRQDASIRYSYACCPACTSSRNCLSIALGSRMWVLCTRTASRITPAVIPCATCISAMFQFACCATFADSN